LLDLYRDMQSNESVVHNHRGYDQQRMMFSYFRLRESLSIELDYRGEIFHSMFLDGMSVCSNASRSSIEIDADEKGHVKPFYDDEKKISPALLHFNGKRKRDMFICMSKQGYFDEDSGRPNALLMQDVASVTFRLTRSKDELRSLNTSSAANNSNLHDVVVQSYKSFCSSSLYQRRS